VALALSGGAARGFAHLGVVRALREAGVPIDVVCGTSMGSIVAAQCALGWDVARMRDELHRCLVARSPFDYTMPLVSAVSGERYDRMLQEFFGDKQVEDTWLRCATVSASLANAAPVVHRRGPLWLATRCSSALPGLLPPVERDGDLLVDGVFLDNLPADVAREEGRGRTIAVNVIPKVGAAEWEALTEKGSALKHVMRMVAPSSRSRIPPIMNLVMQGFFLSTLSDAARIREEVDLYVEPDTSRFWFLDLDCIDDAIAEGHAAARREIAAWIARDPSVIRP
jgi:predicted acylesterase/phospholipase RssA